MARPNKVGLDYYPSDVNYHNDKKVIYIEGCCGLVGVEILRRLDSLIYSEGYYLAFGELEQPAIAVMLRVPLSTLLTVVNSALTIGWYDPDQHDRHKILTSKQVQDTYQAATLKRKLVVINPSYCSSNPVSGELTPVSEELSTQSKVKKSKVNKRRKENIKRKENFCDLQTEKNNLENPHEPPDTSANQLPASPQRSTSAGLTEFRAPNPKAGDWGSITHEAYKQILQTLCNGDSKLLNQAVAEMADWSASGRKRKHDWAATLRNWIRRTRVPSRAPKTFRQIEIDEDQAQNQRMQEWVSAEEN
jgi:hypothetical protein